MIGKKKTEVKAINEEMDFRQRDHSIGGGNDFACRAGSDVS
jgi:hypothetical protein